MIAARGRARAMRVLASSLVLVIACSDPKVVEDTAAACANAKDDDGDGLIDCDDPDCSSTEACERTAEKCSNGTDDDGDGSIDCRQQSCKLLAQCKDAVETDCNVTAQTGCPRGKGCYITADNRHWCALEGPARLGDACGNTDPSDRSQGCAAGHLCVPGKRCAPVCVKDYECTRNSICQLLGSDVRVCTSSCFDASDCHSDEECIALQRTGLALEAGGWAHQCAERNRYPAGAAKAGEPCFDDQVSRPPSERCAPGHLCVPEPAGDRCREVCRARADGEPSATCSLGLHCLAVVPFSAQESRFNEPYVIGVCIP
jgi:hypothetical protein